LPIKNKWFPFTKPVIEDLPMRSCGVYEVGKARGNKVLYIGKSVSSIRSRLITHKAKIEFQECTHFRMKRITYPEDADKLEKQLLIQYIKRYGIRPQINKIMAPGDPWAGILY